MGHGRAAPLPTPATRDPRPCRAALPRRASCDGCGRDRHHARRHSRRVARGLCPRARCRISTRLRVLFCRIRASLDGGTRSSRRGTPRNVAVTARLGHLARRHIRFPRCASGRARRAVQPPLRQPVRLHVGVQARPLLTGPGEPGAGHRQCQASAALGAARFRHIAPARGEPRLSIGTFDPARRLRLDPGSPVVGDRHDDDHWLWRCRTADSARPDAGRGRHDQRHSRDRVMGGHSRDRVFRGDAAARISADLGSRRQGAVLPRCRRRGHRRCRAAPAS